MNHWRKKRFLGLFLMCLMLTAFTAGTSFAAEFLLRAESFDKTMPDGTVIPMWGFALDNSFGSGSGGTPTSPGPALVVPPGDTTITIHLDNNLTVPISVVIPGQITTMVPTWTDGTTGARTSVAQRVRSFTHETPPGNTAAVDYTWTNINPGTYMYHSGTQPQVQVQMGLFGAVIADSAANNVYNTASSAYTNQVTLFYSEIDPALHNAVATGNYGPGLDVTSTLDYYPKYFLVNGEPFSAGSSPIPAGRPAQKLLIRFLNAGLNTHVPTLGDGNYMDVIAEDGRLYPYMKKQYSVMLSPLKTMDAVYTPGSAGYIPVYDGSLSLTNNTDSPGGMLSFLGVASTLQYSLTISTPVSGGAIQSTSAPGGINCGTDCVEVYNRGAQVYLAAVPDPGFHLLSWNGNCSGRGNCFLVMNANRLVGATFSASKPASIATYNGTSGMWSIDVNGNGVWNGKPLDWFYILSGVTGQPVVGDWDGDGTANMGFFQNGTWYLDYNGNGIWEPFTEDRTYRFGNAGDLPVVGDWNSDGKTEVGVFRAGKWYLDTSGDGIWSGSLVDAFYNFGIATDVPVIGDWNGDGTSNIGTFRTGRWYLDVNGNGIWDGTTTDVSYTFGAATDVPVPGLW